MSEQLLQSYTDNSRYFVIPEPLLDLVTSLKLSYSETMVYVLHFNMGYRWKSWISTLTCRKISERLRITERSVSLAHKKLTELGLIQRERGQRYSKFKEAPAATRIILNDRLKQAFEDAPERGQPNQVTDRKPMANTKPTTPAQETAQASTPALPGQHQFSSDKKHLQHIDPGSLPSDIASMIELGLSRTVLVGTLKARNDLSSREKEGILAFYDRKHPRRMDPKLQQRSQDKIPDAESQPQQAGSTCKRRPTTKLITDIEQKLSWAVRGKQQDLRPGIASEIAYAITLGTLSDKSINHGLNIALKLVREGRWTPPKGFFLHEEKFARRA